MAANGAKWIMCSSCPKRSHLIREYSLSFFVFVFGGGVGTVASYITHPTPSTWSNTWKSRLQKELNFFKVCQASWGRGGGGGGGKANAMSPRPANRAAEYKTFSAEVGDLRLPIGAGPLSMPDGHDMLQIRVEPVTFFSTFFPPRRVNND